MADLQKNLPADVHVSTDIFRQSRFIDSSIDNVKNSLFEGSFFVVIVLFLFLMNIRTTVISLVALPLSLLVSILTLHYMGLTINTMSLGGMMMRLLMWRMYINGYGKIVCCLPISNVPFWKSCSMHLAKYVCRF